MEKRSLEVADVVVFVDELGHPHNALVTAVHGEITQMQVRDGFHHVDIVEGGGPMIWNVPCINLVYLSDNVNKQDPYGRQTEHASSVVYKDDNSAHGNYFMWLGETPNPKADTKR